LIADPFSPTEPVRIPSPVSLQTFPAHDSTETASATFTIEYIPDGGTDDWDEPCYEFPMAARTAFNAAAAIWGNLLSSTVPITIRAGWADLGGSTLGFAGGGPLHRNFTGAPLSNTWYIGSLANSRAGTDLAPAHFDIHITYNRNFSWYFGTDGNTPAGQYDFMSVVLHEICHGLNFSGSMRYNEGQGSWGYGTTSPNIYDTFARDGSGIALTNTTTYPNPSTELGTALTSNSVWNHGTQAMSANGNQRVKLYAPSTWAPGSSFSHLDHATFSGTVNRLMVYVISSGSSIHDPGPVTMGMLRDFGWQPGIQCGTPSSIPQSSSRDRFRAAPRS